MKKKGRKTQGCKYLNVSTIILVFTLEIDAAGNKHKKCTGAFLFDNAI